MNFTGIQPIRPKTLAAFTAYELASLASQDTVLIVECSDGSAAGIRAGDLIKPTPIEQGSGT